MTIMRKTRTNAKKQGTAQPIPLSEMIIPRRESTHEGADRMHDELRRSGHELDEVHQVVKLLSQRLDDNSKVLEIGSGIATSSIFLAKQNKSRILAIDISDVAVKRAKEQIEEAGLSTDEVTIIAADFKQSRFKTQFDAITLNFVLHYLDSEEEVDEFVKKMMDLTKSGGFNAVSYWLSYSVPDHSVRRVNITDHLEGLYQESGWNILENGENKVYSGEWESNQARFFLAQKPSK